MVFGIDDYLIAATVVSVGTQIYGSISGANAEKEAQERQRALTEQQIAELEARQRINEQVIREKSAYAQSNYQTAFSSSGRAGAGIGGIIKMRKDTEDNIALSRRDLEFKAYMMRAGADIDAELASDRMTASYITGVGTLLGAAGNLYATNKMIGPNKPGITDSSALPTTSGVLNRSPRNVLMQESL